MNPIKLHFPDSQTDNWIPLNLDNVKYIVLHHPKATTASPDEINEWHLGKGWNGGFGYNEYVRKDGTVYIGRGDNIGAQCQNYNSKSYGICCEGNYEIETEMPEAQKLAVIERIRFNKPRFPNYQLTAPHSQFVETECPGKYFPMVEILKRIEVVNVTVDEALAIQVAAGVINSPEYWKKVVDTTKNFDQYVINVGKKLQELRNEK
jgi:hypothetical protein